MARAHHNRYCSQDTVTGILIVTNNDAKVRMPEPQIGD